jgi:hypothetical protein
MTLILCVMKDYNKEDEKDVKPTKAASKVSHLAQVYPPFKLMSAEAGGR